MWLELIDICKFEFGADLSKFCCRTHLNDDLNLDQDHYSPIKIIFNIK